MDTVSYTGHNNIYPSLRGRCHANAGTRGHSCSYQPGSYRRSYGNPNAGTGGHSYSCQAGSYRRSYGNPKTNPCCSANSNAHAGTRRFSSGRRWKYTSFCQ